MAQSPRLSTDELEALINEADNLREVAGKAARLRQVEIAHILKTRRWPYRTKDWHYQLHQSAAHVEWCFAERGEYNPPDRLPLEKMIELAEEACGLQFLSGQAARDRQSEIGEILAASLHLLETWELSQVRHTIAMCADGNWFEEPQPDLTPAEIADINARITLDDEIPF